MAEIHNFAVEPTEIEGLRPDALTFFTLNNNKTKQLCFVEVELSNRFNIAKYERLFHSGDYKKTMPLFPRIIAITDKSIPSTKLDIVIIKTDLSNIDILK